MKKKGIRSLFVIALVLLSGYLLIGNPIVFWHNWELKRSIQSIEPERKTVAFNDLVPFEWDRVYTFAPYTSKKRNSRSDRVSQQIDPGNGQRGDGTAAVCKGSLCHCKRVQPCRFSGLSSRFFWFHQPGRGGSF